MICALLVAVSACVPDDPVELTPPLPTPTSDTSTTSTTWMPSPLGPPIEVRDVAIDAGFQDSSFGHYKRGRSCLSADFDGDGWVDVLVGNPGDESHILLNTTGRTGALSFEQGPILAQGDSWWGGTLGDLDNDGDVDAFIGAGGNEEVAWDALMHNRLVEDGAFSMVDVAVTAGVAGVAPDQPWASASARAADFDNDGRLDVWVNAYDPPRSWLPDRPDVWDGSNLLWRNLGDGTFEDVAPAVGLRVAEGVKTMNSTFLDYDDDGDLDLYESNLNAPNHVWKNLLVEEGAARFVDVTAEVTLDGGDMSYPDRVFASAAADFNGDGWEDLLAFVRPYEPEDTPYPEGHILLLNVEGRGFVNWTRHTGLNEPFVNWYRDHEIDGVMGGQIGDLNVDGVPDVWIGQGRPEDGTNNLLFLSTGTKLVREGDLELMVPTYENASSWIDFEAAADPASGIELMPPFPYRTHGTCVVDYDQDGVPEIAVVNGGPAAYSDAVREPNRLFDFTYAEPRSWLRVVLQGDGLAVNRSGIGSRVTVTASRPDGLRWQRRQWLHGGHGFSAVNDLSLFFGLADATAVERVEVRWTDGRVDVVEDVALDRTLTLTY